MTEDKFIELINKEIDGTISKSEKDRLHEYLRSHPEETGVYDKMVALDAELNSVKAVEPPASLMGKILKHIDHTRYAQNRKPAWSWEWLLSPRYRPVYAFAAGILIGIVAFGILNTPIENDLHTVTGTIGIQHQRIADIPVTANEVSGNMTVTRKNSEYTLEVTLQSDEIYELVISYNPVNMEFSSVVPVTPQKTVIENVGDQLRLSGFKNAHHVVIFQKVSHEPDFINIMLIVAQEQIISKKLILE